MAKKERYLHPMLLLLSLRKVFSSSTLLPLSSPPPLPLDKATLHQSLFTFWSHLLPHSFSMDSKCHFHSSINLFPFHNSLHISPLCCVTFFFYFSFCFIRKKVFLLQIFCCLPTKFLIYCLYTLFTFPISVFNFLFYLLAH